MIHNTHLNDFSDLIGQMNELVERAYDLGVVAGRKSAEKEFKDKLSAILSSETPANLPGFSATTRPPDRPPPTRAPRGSVEPKIISALEGFSRGKKPSEIAGETGVPENSVRGKLNKLHKENRVVKRGELWALSQQPVAQED